MQIPVLAGPEIDQRDQPGSPPVAIVNEVFPKANFGDQNPLGQRISIRREPPFKEMKIVGIAKNARHGNLKGEFPPVVYLPFKQGTYVPLDEITFALRTSGDPLRYVNTVREIVRRRTRGYRDDRQDRSGTGRPHLVITPTPEKCPIPVIIGGGGVALLSLIS